MIYTILLLGSEGQLGKSLRAEIEMLPQHSYHFIYRDIETLDITDPEALRKIIGENSVNVIVNAAAYTAVDKAEGDSETAFAVNAFAVAKLAELAREKNIYLIHISTDYVFDGKATKPYRPEDAVNPVSVYGKSKAAGETAIAQSGVNAAIIRTSWLYSPYGHNFVKSIHKASQEHKTLRVVNDQTGAPTYARDLARAIIKLIGKPELHHGLRIYHFANEGAVTWYDFATEIVRMNGTDCTVQPIATEEYPTAAIRPKYSVFELTKIKEELGITIPDWKSSLKDMMNQLIL